MKYIKLTNNFSGYNLTNEGQDSAYRYFHSSATSTVQCYYTFYSIQVAPFSATIHFTPCW